MLSEKPIFRTTPGRAENDRRNNFDFLRFLMASLVLFYHCYPLLGGGAKFHSERIASVAGLAAGAAVDFFFIISGFLVTQSWQRTPQVQPFLWKRVLRIYPAFILVSLFCALVIGPLGAANAAEYFRHFHPLGFAAYMLLVVEPFLPPVFLHVPYAGQVDGSFWTLRYEFQCYLSVLLLGLLGLFAALVALGLGAIFSRYWELSVVTAGTYLLFWVAFRPILRLASFAKYGDFSYGVYLFAYPIQQTLICYIQPQLTPLRLFFLAFPLTLLLAAISWHCVEKPALRLRKSVAPVGRS